MKDVGRSIHYMLPIFSDGSHAKIIFLAIATR